MAGSLDLEFKWTSTREAQGTVEAYDLSQATPHAFFMVFNDRGGSGPGAVDITAVGAFEDAADCLAYLRYYEMSEMLDWRATFEQGSIDDGLDHDLAPLEVQLSIDLTTLAAALEQAMGSQVDAETLDSVRALWNEAFALTNPGSTVEAWGPLRWFLRSDWVLEMLLDEDHDGDYDEFVADVRSGALDPDDPADFTRVLDALAALESF